MKLLKTISALTLASMLLGSPLAMAAEAAAPGTTSKEAAASASVTDEKALAEAKITKDQALELAQKAVAIPEGYTLQNVNLFGGYYPQQGPVWNLNYVKKQGTQYLGSMGIQLNAITGKLIGFNLNNNDPSHKASYPPKVDYQGAKEIAAQWIAEKNPALKDQLQYNDSNEKSFRPPLNGEVRYEIRYDRTYNGIAFPQNYVSVSINGEGDVVGYSNVWNEDLKFDDAQGILSAEEAMKAMRKRTEPSLSYVIPYQSRDKKPLLIYSMGMYPVDAKTGSIYLPQGVQPDEVTPSIATLTDKPLGSAPAASLNLTKDEAIDRITSVFKLPEGAKLQDASYSENTDDVSGKTTSMWNLSWNIPVSDTDARSGKPMQGVWASVNSKTGEIVNYNVNQPYGPGSQSDVKVSAEDAKASAINFIKKMLPAYTNQLALQTASEQSAADIVKQGGIYTYSFARYIDGVRAGYDNVYVSIDAATGEIRNYSFGFSQFDYPAQKPQAIDAEKAEDLLFSAFDLKLQYVNDVYAPPFMPLGGPVSDAYMRAVKQKAVMVGQEPPKDTAVHLIYALVPKYPSRSFVLNAESGGWVSPDSGEPVTLENVKVTDIDGHWAQSALQLMLDYQALDVKDGKVNPDAAITRGELIKMLVISMNGGNFGFNYTASRANSFADVKSESPYFPYVERAVDLRILDRTDGGSFKPDEPLTREDMAELIVKALGYGKLAEHDDIFSKNFADEAQMKHPGDVAIVAGLGIMTAPGGLFEPVQTVTKAQAATAFSRYLQARAELQSGPSFGPVYG